MRKRILVLAGSPRKHGNSDRLADAFIKGANEAGNVTEKIYVTDLNLKGCLGCLACQRNGGQCVQKDDMQSLYEKVTASNVIVLAFPVYFYTWNAQLKLVLDRLYALIGSLKDKTFYMLASCAAPSMEYEEPVLDAFRKYISCFRAGGNKEGGYIFVFNTVKMTDVDGTEALGKAYNLGKMVME